MPIDLIKPGGDLAAVDKLNQTIAKANEVDGKASTAALTTGIAAEAAARRAEILALPMPIPVQHRPGDAPLLFGRSLADGEPELIPPLPASLLRYGEAGKVVRLTGDDIVAPRHLYAIEPGRRYLVIFAVQRRVNSADPDNDAIRCALAWYGQGKGRLLATPQTVVQDLLGLTTGSGRQVVRAVVSRSAGAGVDIVAPAGARHSRPYCQGFGTLVQNDVEVINWVDITDAIAFAPDVSSLQDQIDQVLSLGLGDRVGELEAQVTAPNDFRVATIADLIAANVPVTADTVQVLGFYAPGDGGGHRRIRSPGADISKVQSADGALWAVAEAVPALQHFGGVDDGATDNRDPLARAKSHLGATGRTLRLPKIGTGVYEFSTPGALIDLSGITAQAEAGVKLRGPIAFPSTTRATDIPVDYRDAGGTEFENFRLPAYQARPIEQKQRWLTGGDLDHKEISAYDMTTGVAEKLDLLGSDAWVTDAAVSSSADTRTINLTADGFMRAAFVPVRGGDEISVAFWPGNFIRSAVIRYAGGYATFYANDGLATLRIKPIGGAATEFTGLSWFGRADNPAWAPNKAEWKIRIYDSRTWSLLLNGMEIIAPQVVAGPIMDAGFGMYGVDSITASMSYLTKTRRSEPAGQAPARVLCIGDSTTEDIIGGWPYAMKETLNGSLGLRVWDVFNQAVAGQTSAQQLTALNANDAQLTIATHVVIHVGINDSQGSGPATTLANIGAMIDRIVSRGIPAGRVVLCVPYLWYTKILAGGVKGFDAGPNDAHWLLRAGIKRLAATRGCRLVDFQEVLAAVTPIDLNRPLQVDPIVRDNIHPTLYGYRAMGEAVAREVLASSALRMTQRMAAYPLHASWLRNSWALDGGRPAQIEVTADGMVSLTGLLNKGDVAEPVIIARLPPNMRPSTTREYAARTNTGSITVLYVGPDGNLTLSSFPGGATSVALDNVVFPASD
ncbi:SGNH/GDSL hydrolase family protein [Bosea eneae]|uniref:SGNH/GDSL hydrolase family protein n=1 Tax=Bosea eneae TaxID=151454 RepID=A0ABW0IXP1_9HYPH